MRSWYRLGSANKRDVSKAEECKRKLLKTLAPFPIVFFVAWTPSLLYRMVVIFTGEDWKYFAAVAMVCSRSWGLLSSIVYSTSHWVMLAQGVSNFFNLRLRGKNNMEMKVSSIELLTEYKEEQKSPTDGLLQSSLQAPLLSTAE